MPDATYELRYSITYTLNDRSTVPSKLSFDIDRHPAWQANKGQTLLRNATVTADIHTEPGRPPAVHASPNHLPARRRTAPTLARPLSKASPRNRHVRKRSRPPTMSGRRTVVVTPRVPMVQAGEETPRRLGRVRRINLSMDSMRAN